MWSSENKYTLHVLSIRYTLHVLLTPGCAVAWGDLSPQTPLVSPLLFFVRNTSALSAGRSLYGVGESSAGGFGCRRGRLHRHRSQTGVTIRSRPSPGARVAQPSVRSALRGDRIHPAMDRSSKVSDACPFNLKCGIHAWRPCRRALGKVEPSTRECQASSLPAGSFLPRPAQ
jgi:hypothetical protein